MAGGVVVELCIWIQSILSTYLDICEFINDVDAFLGMEQRRWSFVMI